MAVTFSTNACIELATKQEIWAVRSLRLVPALQGQRNGPGRAVWPSGTAILFAMWRSAGRWRTTVKTKGSPRS